MILFLYNNCTFLYFLFSSPGVFETHVLLTSRAAHDPREYTTFIYIISDRETPAPAVVSPPCCHPWPRFLCHRIHFLCFSPFRWFFFCFQFIWIEKWIGDRVAVILSIIIYCGRPAVITVSNTIYYAQIKLMSVFFLLLLLFVIRKVL